MAKAAGPAPKFQVRAPKVLHLPPEVARPDPSDPEKERLKTWIEEKPIRLEICQIGSGEVRQHSLGDRLPPGSDQARRRQAERVVKLQSDRVVAQIASFPDRADGESGIEKMVRDVGEHRGDSRLGLRRETHDFLQRRGRGGFSGHPACELILHKFLPKSFDTKEQRGGRRPPGGDGGLRRHAPLPNLIRVAVEWPERCRVSDTSSPRRDEETLAAVE